MDEYNNADTEFNKPVGVFREDFNVVTKKRCKVKMLCDTVC